MTKLSDLNQSLTEIHHGQIVELNVRKNGYNITELARLAHVKRRTVYNWFNQKYLKPEIIHRVGCILKHDFSKEFPGMFTGVEFKSSAMDTKFPDPQLKSDLDQDNHVWKNRYINLLEEYRKVLCTYLQVKERRFEKTKVL
jgi:lambda repressor-like predicted transcriptional regulator